MRKAQEKVNQLPTIDPDRAHALAIAPLPTFRCIQPKTWAGALITRDDFDLGRQGARRSSADGVYSEDMVTYFPDSHQGV